MVTLTALSFAAAAIALSLLPTGYFTVTVEWYFFFCLILSETPSGADSVKQYLRSGCGLYLQYWDVDHLVCGIAMAWPQHRAQIRLLKEFNITLTIRRGASRKFKLFFLNETLQSSMNMHNLNISTLCRTRLRQ